MNIAIVPYSPELTPQLLELQTHLWHSDIRLNAAYLKWKYFESPYAGEPLIHLALSGGKVVGMRGMFPTCWEAGGADPRILPYADDLVVAPEFRNRGVVSRLMQANFAAGAARGFPFCLSLSAGAVTYLSSLAAGWRAVGDYRTVERERVVPIAGERLCSFLERRLSSRAGLRLRQALVELPFARLDRMAPVAPGPEHRIILSRDARPDSMAALVTRITWDGRIRVVRDAAYFRWRFQNPLSRNRFLFWVDESGALQGYLVLQMRVGQRPGHERVSLVDWEAVDDRVRAGLLNAAMRWGLIPRLEIWTVGLTDSVRALLAAWGFRPRPPKHDGGWPPHLLVRRLGDGPADSRWDFGDRDLLHLEDWDLRKLYSMSG